MKLIRRRTDLEGVTEPSQAEHDRKADGFRRGKAYAIRPKRIILCAGLNALMQLLRRHVRAANMFGVGKQVGENRDEEAASGCRADAAGARCPS
jgi:phage major head subunit gpT-like protein